MKGCRILLGVTGSIAAYKAAELTSRMVAEGARVTVIMTRAARKFVGAATFETLSRGPVVTSMFRRAPVPEPVHVSLADEAHLYVIAPATADVIGKLAAGLADDMVTCTALAAVCPILIAPAMNDRMYAHPAVQSNVTRLKEIGYLFVGPEEGRLATGRIGRGRLASVDRILDAARDALKRPLD